MSQFPRAQSVLGLFPRWKTTPDLLKFAETLLGGYPEDEVQNAVRAHRLARGKAEDPDLDAIERWLRDRKYASVREEKAQAAAPKPDVWTPTDREWVSMMESWRCDYRQANPENPARWIAESFAVAARDLAKFGIKDPSCSRMFLRRIARDCGAKIGGSDVADAKGAA